MPEKTEVINVFNCKVKTEVIEIFSRQVKAAIETIYVITSTSKELLEYELKKEQLEANTMLEVCTEEDFEGKKLYTNDALRKAAVIELLSKNEEYAEIKNKSQSLPIDREHEKLKLGIMTQQLKFLTNLILVIST